VVDPPICSAARESRAAVVRRTPQRNNAQAGPFCKALRVGL